MADRPTFYVDRCLGKVVPAALREAGADVRIHDDHFAQEESDTDWIPIVSANGWVILTKDKNIRRTCGERGAVLAAEARVITLGFGNMRAADMAALFVSHLEAMEQLVALQSPPFVAVLGPRGLEVVLPKPES